MDQHRFKQRVLVAAVGCGLLSTLPGTAAAAETAGGIQEVVVTAQKREENLQTTPIAISAFSGDTLAKLGVNSFEGVAKNSPSISLTPYPSSSNLLILYMRGQGVSDPMQITSDGSVALYEDGFYISRPQASTFDLADVERVEVLRGPQGTLYGRNTTGGAVNLISKKPTGEFGFKQDLTFGSRNQFRSLTAVNLPKWNGVSSKITLLKSSIDGYVKNTGSGHDYGEQAQQAARLALRWDGFDGFTAEYFLEKGNLDSTPDYYQNEAWAGTNVVSPTGTYSYPTGGPQSRTYRPVDLNLSTSDFESHGLTLAWDVSDNLTIKSLTGYRKLNWHAYQDYVEGFAYNGFNISTFAPIAPPGMPLSFTSDDLVKDHQFSQEFQFIGSALNDHIKYVAGLYYFKEGSSHYETVVSVLPASVGGPLTTVQDRYVTADAKSQAAYAQVTWTPDILDNRLDLTVGARYTKDDRSAERSFIINGLVLENGATPIMVPNYVSYPYLGLPSAPNGAANDKTYKRFNPAFTINYTWSDDLSTYAKVVTGYKAGGSSEASPIGGFSETFSPEKVVTLELGLKSYWFERRLRANFAAFQSKFDDMQLAFTVDPNNSAVGIGLNAGKATVTGGEVELLYMPIDDVTLDLEYSYLHPVFDKVTAPTGTVYDSNLNPSSPYVAGENIKDSFVLPYAPKHSVNVGADYTFMHFDSATLSAHLNYRFQSQVFDTANDGPAVPNRNLYAQPAYGLMDGRLTLAMDLPRGDRAKVAIWGKNLTHKQYKSDVIGQGGLISTGGVPAGLTSQAVIWGQPPSYGIDLSYEY